MEKNSAVFFLNKKRGQFFIFKRIAFCSSPFDRISHISVIFLLMNPRCPVKAVIVCEAVGING